MKRSFVLLLLLIGAILKSSDIGVVPYLQSYAIAIDMAQDFLNPEHYRAWYRNYCIRGLHDFASNRLGHNTLSRLEQRKQQRSRIAEELFIEAEQEAGLELLILSYWEQQVKNRGMWYKSDAGCNDYQKIDICFKMLIDWEEWQENKHSRR